MLKWILIFYAVSSGYATSFSQEFTTFQACDDARGILVGQRGVEVARCVCDGYGCAGGGGNMRAVEVIVGDDGRYSKTSVPGGGSGVGSDNQ